MSNASTSRREGGKEKEKRVSISEMYPPPPYIGLGPTAYQLFDINHLYLRTATMSLQNHSGLIHSDLCLRRVSIDRN